MFGVVHKWRVLFDKDLLLMGSRFCWYDGFRLIAWWLCCNNVVLCYRSFFEGITEVFVSWMIL